jgi:hypothetical protein
MDQGNGNVYYLRVNVRYKYCDLSPICLFHGYDERVGTGRGDKKPCICGLRDSYEILPLIETTTLTLLQ